MKSLRQALTSSIRWRVRGELKAQIELLKAEITQESAEQIAVLSLRVLELENHILDLRRLLQQKM